MRATWQIPDMIQPPASCNPKLLLSGSHCGMEIGSVRLR